MKRQPARHRSHQRGPLVKRSYVRHAVPVVVWLVAVAAVVALFQRRAQRFEIVGIARSQVRQIAATSTARIRDIRVGLFEPVKAGQILAVVDTILENEQTLEAELRTELASAAAEIEHLLAQLVPTQELMLAEACNLEVNRASDLRRFSADVENARLRILELQVAIAADRILLGDAAMEVAIVQKLVDEGAAARYELDKAKVQQESLAAKIQQSEVLLAQAREDLVQTRRRESQFVRQELAHPSVGQALDVIRKEIRVQEELVKGLLRQLKALEAREAVELRSPIDGVVIPLYVRANEVLQQRPGENLMRRVGEVVTAGDPVLAVAQREPTEIVAYVNEPQIGSVRENMPVQLVKPTAPAQIAQSRILSVGPAIEIMPQRLWRNPAMPEWGRSVSIGIPDGMTVVPGEIVGVKGL